MATESFLGVELARTGRWNASAGDGTIETEDIKSMIDTFGLEGVDAVPVKLGHNDSRFQGADGMPPTDADGHPAYGWLANLRASADGQKLIGDIHGVPAKLAAILPTAFRRRSIEMLKGPRIGGTVRRAVLSAVSLLGVSPPAVKDLNDLIALYADQLAASVTVEFSDADTPPVHPTRAALADGQPQQPNTHGGTVARNITPQARLALGLDDAATDEQIDAAAKLAGLAFLPDPAPAVAADGAAPAGGGLPPATGQAATPAAPVVTPVEAVTPVVQPVVEQKVAASSGPATTTVDAVSFSAMQAQLSAATVQLAAYTAEKDRERRDAIINRAVSEGRLHPQMFASYRTALDNDEAGITTILSNSPPLFPTVPLGHSQPSTGQDDTTAGDARAFATYVR